MFGNKLVDIAGMSYSGNDNGSRSGVSSHLGTKTRDTFNVVGKKFSDLTNGRQLLVGNIYGSCLTLADKGKGTILL